MLPNYEEYEQSRADNLRIEQVGVQVESNMFGLGCGGTTHTINICLTSAGNLAFRTRSFVGRAIHSMLAIGVRYNRYWFPRSESNFDRDDVINHYSDVLYAFSRGKSLERIA